MSDWFVVQCNDCNKKQYFYDIDYYNEDDFHCNKCESTSYRIIKNEQYFDSQDIATILGNELEDGNYHQLVAIPRKLLSALKENDIDEKKCRIIMKQFSKVIWQEI